MGKRKRENESYRRLSTETVLPEWLVAELPEHEAHIVVSWEEDGFHLSDTDEIFATVSEAYDAAQAVEGKQTVLDKSVHKHGGKMIGGAFFVDVEEGKTSARLLISHTTEDTEGLLKYAYGHWLEAENPAYLKNQDDWVVAYSWLRSHPIFWKRTKEEKTVDWETDYGITDFYMWVTKRKGKPRVYLEAGAHVAPSYTHSYHDLRLDVQAETIEKAYIRLAKKVNKFFNADGTEKVGIKYKKSAFEKHLDKSLES